MGDNVQFVQDAFVTFNQADVEGLTKIIADDAVQHMPGNGRYAGDHVGRDAILAMYGGLGEATGGTFRAELGDVAAVDDRTVTAQYRATGTRDGATLDSPRSITFTIEDGRIVDLLDQDDDVAAWDRFFG
jgi:ketosteroid isomerase-like protein